MIWIAENNSISLYRYSDLWRFFLVYLEWTIWEQSPVWALFLLNLYQVDYCQHWCEYWFKHWVNIGVNIDVNMYINSIIDSKVNIVNTDIVFIPVSFTLLASVCHWASSLLSFPLYYIPLLYDSSFNFQFIFILLIHPFIAFLIVQHYWLLLIAFQWIVLLM